MPKTKWQDRVRLTFEGDEIKDLKALLGKLASENRPAGFNFKVELTEDEQKLVDEMHKCVK
jgi:predicted secreted protein